MTGADRRDLAERIDAATRRLKLHNLRFRWCSRCEVWSCSTRSGCAPATAAPARARAFARRRGEHDEPPRHDQAQVLRRLHLPLPHRRVAALRMRSTRTNRRTPRAPPRPTLPRRPESARTRAASPAEETMTWQLRNLRYVEDKPKVEPTSAAADLSTPEPATSSAASPKAAKRSPPTRSRSRRSGATTSSSSPTSRWARTWQRNACARSASPTRTSTCSATSSPTPSPPATTSSVRGRLQRRLLRRRVTLAIYDASVGAFDLAHLDDGKRGDAEKFARLFVRPFWQQGIATVVIDHVTKSKDGRGRYAIGSERKLGGADVTSASRSSRSCAAASPASCGSSTTRTGAGSYRGRAPANSTSQATPRHTRSDGSSGRHQPTHPAPQDSGQPTSWTALPPLELHPDGLTRSKLYKATSGKRQWLVVGLDLLIGEGFVRDDGSLLVPSSPFREDEHGSPVPKPFPAVPGSPRSPGPRSPRLRRGRERERPRRPSGTRTPRAEARRHRRRPSMNDRPITQPIFDDWTPPRRPTSRPSPRTRNRPAPRSRPLHHRRRRPPPARRNPARHREAARPQEPGRTRGDDMTARPRPSENRSDETRAPDPPARREKNQATVGASRNLSPENHRRDPAFPCSPPIWSGRVGGAAAAVQRCLHWRRGSVDASSAPVAATVTASFGSGIARMCGSRVRCAGSRWKRRLARALRFAGGAVRCRGRVRSAPSCSRAASASSARARVPSGADAGSGPRWRPRSNAGSVCIVVRGRRRRAHDRHVADDTPGRRSCWFEPGNDLSSLSGRRAPGCSARLERAAVPGGTWRRG